jgi:hypothetical protein
MWQTPVDMRRGGFALVMTSGLVPFLLSGIAMGDHEFVEFPQVVVSAPRGPVAARPMIMG